LRFWRIGRGATADRRAFAIVRSDSRRTTAMPPLHRSALPAILIAGGVCASIDIVYACSFHYLVNQVPPLRILQSIASGLQGKAAFDGGLASGLLGLFAHYFILVVAAGLYYAASRRLHWLLQRPWQAGMLFGLAIWLTMNYVVLPLSAAPKFKGGWGLGFWTNLAVHILLLGPSIALLLRRFATRRGGG
jgi:hypothetical protein